MILKKHSVLVIAILITSVSLLASTHAQAQEPCTKAEEIRQNIEEVSRALADVETKLTDQVMQFEQLMNEKNDLQEQLGRLHDQLQNNRQQIKEANIAAKTAHKKNNTQDENQLRQQLVELNTEKQKLKTKKASLTAKIKELKERIKPFKKEIRRLKNLSTKNKNTLERYSALHEKKKKLCQQWHANGCPTKNLMERLGKQRFKPAQLKGSELQKHCKQIKDAKAKDIRCRPAILPPICTKVCWDKTTEYARYYEALDRARNKTEEEKREITNSICPRLKISIQKCPLDNHPYCQ